MICCLSEPSKYNRSYFFPLHHIISNRFEVELYCIVIGVNRITSLAASYVSSMYRIIGYASRYGVMEMHITNIYII